MFKANSSRKQTLDNYTVGMLELQGLVITWTGLISNVLIKLRFVGLFEKSGQSGH